MSGAAAAPVIELRGITVELPGVRALDALDFRLFPGEVHAVMGENGAGKSTLIGVITGTRRPTARSARSAVSATAGRPGSRRCSRTCS